MHTMNAAVHTMNAAVEGGATIHTNNAAVEGGATILINQFVGVINPAFRMPPFFPLFACVPSNA